MKQPMSHVTELAREIVRNARTDREKAVLIHDFVRDNVRYGFTSRFDEATVEETLQAGVGHCNPQTDLFVTMLRDVGVEARYHFVTLSGEILRGVLPNAPAFISHGFAEVKLNGRWLQVDSYIVDPEHAGGAAARLDLEGREMGYGFHRRGTTSWDGRSNAFSQFADPEMLIEDQGVWSQPEEFFSSEGFRHRVGPVTYSAMFRVMPSLMFKAFSTLVDFRLSQLRQAAQPKLPDLAAALPDAA